MRRRRVVTAGVAAMMVALALAACRSDGGGTPSGDGEVATDFGVTDEPCPNAVNPDNGCIYLGILTDLTGPFAGFGGPLTAAQEAFWRRVNEQGGIRAPGVDKAYDVDVTTYSENTGYDVAEHSRLYEEMKPHILALAQSLGSPTTAAILPDMRANNIIGVPAAYNSEYSFEDVILESPANYCVEAMNAVDYAVETYGVESVLAVHFPNDYGLDAAAGVMLAAETHGLEFEHIPTPPGGGETQAEAIARIVASQPDLVYVTAGPVELGTIVGGAVQNGYTGRFIGSNPTYNPALLESPAGPAILAYYQVSTGFQNWATDTPGHQAMREALGEPDNLNDGYTIGWIWQYPLKAALEKALENRDLTRAGVAAAARSLTSVDYEGMLPAGAGNYAGGADAQVRHTLIGNPDPESPTGISSATDFFVGPTAAAWEPTTCWELLE